MAANANSINTTGLISHHRLKIAEINVNSLITNERRASLTEFLAKHNPDAVLLCETKLNHRHRVSFKNYTFLRNDRLNAKQAGGTAILIKNNMKFKRIQLGCLESPTLETTIIQIKIQQNNLFLIAAYATSSCKKEFMAELQLIFDKLDLQKTNNYFIIAGDLNAKHADWNNPIDNKRGISLKNWLHQNQIKYKISLLNTAVPSFPKSGAFIDICLADREREQNQIP